MFHQNANFDDDGFTQHKCVFSLQDLADFIFFSFARCSATKKRRKEVKKKGGNEKNKSWVSSLSTSNHYHQTCSRPVLGTGLIPGRSLGNDAKDFVGFYTYTLIFVFLMPYFQVSLLCGA